MTKKKLVKKLIVVLDIANKTDSQKLDKFGNICNGIDGDSSFSAITPTTASTRLLIAGVQTNVTLRDTLLTQIKTITVNVNKAIEDINNVMVDSYAKQVQVISNGNKTKVTGTGFSIKSDGTVAPDNVQTVTGLGLTIGSVNNSFEVQWDALPKKLTKEYRIEISLNPRDVTPIYTHKMSTSKKSALLTNLPNDKEVGVRVITVGKKDGVESDPCTPVIRTVVNPNN